MVTINISLGLLFKIAYATDDWSMKWNWPLLLLQRSHWLTDVLVDKERMLWRPQEHAVNTGWVFTLWNTQLLWSLMFNRKRTSWGHPRYLSSPLPCMTGRSKPIHWVRRHVPSRLSTMASFAKSYIVDVSDLHSTIHSASSERIWEGVSEPLHCCWEW